MGRETRHRAGEAKQRYGRAAADPVPHGQRAGSTCWGVGAVRARAAPAAGGGQGCQDDGCSLFFCTSALSILHSTFAVNHFLFRLTAEGL